MHSKTTSKLLRQNMISTLLPMLLAVLVLGILSFGIIFRYIRNDLQSSNNNILNSMQYNVEQIMRNLDQYIYSFSSNPAIISRTKVLLSSQSYTYAEDQNLLFIKNTVDTPVNTHPYLHSAYVYYFGYNKLLCSDIGLTPLEGFYDIDWVEKLQLSSLRQLLFERREIHRYTFEKKPVKIFSLNHPLSSPGTAGADGLVTLNLDANYVSSIFNKMTRYEGQILLVSDNTGRIVLSNLDELPQLVESLLRQNTLRYEGINYRCYQTTSPQYGLSYYSLIPTSAGYRLATQLMLITLLSILAVGCISSAIAISTTRRNRAHLLAIVDVLAKYEKTGEYVAVESKTSNIYDYIVFNVLNMSVLSNHMRLQLAERRYQKDLYELKALQAQINPHFLFNTLETINWKTIEVAGSHTIVNTMIENLSAILKYCLSNPEEKTFLRNEIDFTRRYIAIQNIRYRKQFTVHWNYDEALLEEKVIKLLFQPLVENSIKHGGLSRKLPVRIRIRVFRRRELLHFSLTDNGIGMDLTKLHQVQEALQEKWRYDTHIGLVNTNQRIRLLYGETYGIHIFSKENWGTVIYFSLPID